MTDKEKNELEKDIEIQVRRLFSEDAEKHRGHLERLLNQLKWAFSILAIVFGLLVTYFSFDTKNKMERSIKAIVLKWQLDDEIRKEVQEETEKMAEQAITQAKEVYTERFLSTVYSFQNSMAKKITDQSKEDIQLIIDSLVQTKSKIDVNEIVRTVSQRVSGSKLKSELFPVGSVIASILPYETFYSETEKKQLGRINYSLALWVPADGRNVTGSRYTRITRNSYVPDLRAVFLRGLNQFYAVDAPVIDDKRLNPEVKSVGEYQADATKMPSIPFKGTTTTSGNHGHTFKEYSHSGSSNGPHWEGTHHARNTPVDGDGRHSHDIIINDGGDPETRPKNIAVYYYVKIN